MSRGSSQRTSGQRMVSVQGRSLVAGTAEGRLLVLEEPISFWGGVNPDTGVIGDRHHPQVGEVVTGAVVVMPSSRGSSSASTVLAEMVRTGTAPAAIVLARPDAIVVLGAVVAAELYHLVMPVITVPVAGLAGLKSGERVRVADNGRLTVEL